MLFTVEERKKMVELRLLERGIETYAELGRRIGVERAHVCRLVAGDDVLPRILCHRIAEELDLNFHEIPLLFGTDVAEQGAPATPGEGSEGLAEGEVEGEPLDADNAST